MASEGENLRALLLTSQDVLDAFADAGGDATAEMAIEQSVIRQDAPDPRIWYQRVDSDLGTTMDTEAGVKMSDWAAECHSEDQNTSLALKEAVQNFLHDYYGAFGDGTTKGIFVESQDDTYEPQGDASEDGQFVTALSVRIVT